MTTNMVEALARGIYYDECQYRGLIIYSWERLSDDDRTFYLKVAERSIMFVRQWDSLVTSGLEPWA